jgi:hypothetical protein
MMAGRSTCGDATPEMNVATESFQHPQDEWSGVLNLPSRFSIETAPEWLCQEQAQPGRSIE